MYKFRMTLLGAAAAVALAAGAHAAELAGDDRDFLVTAAQSGLLEIEASKLAAQRAENVDVRHFAELMVADHTAMDGELKALARSKNVELPAELSSDGRDTLEELREKAGRDFDEEYAEKIAVQAHEDAVDAFEDAAKDAEDQDVRAFAAKHLPQLKGHLEKGKVIARVAEDANEGESGATGGATPASRTEPPIPDKRY